MVPRTSVIYFTILRVARVRGGPVFTPNRWRGPVEAQSLIPRPVAGFLHVAVAELRRSAQGDLRLVGDPRHPPFPVTTGARDVTKAEQYPQQ